MQAATARAADLFTAIETTRYSQAMLPHNFHLLLHCAVTELEAARSRATIHQAFSDLDFIVQTLHTGRLHEGGPGAARDALHPLHVAAHNVLLCPNIWADRQKLRGLLLGLSDLVPERSWFCVERLLSMLDHTSGTILLEAEAVRAVTGSPVERGFASIPIPAVKTQPV